MKAYLPSVAMMNKLGALVFVFWASVSSAMAQTTPDTMHQPWDKLLTEHVVAINHGHSTQVDYAGFAQDKTELEAYLRSLAAVTQVEFDVWSEQRQLAFLINAYNAYTVELILTAYPKLDSIRDLGSLFSSPWKRVFAPLLGKERSLDEIEHQMIRGSGRYQDPRIHFAVNCASIGCPALREEAYVDVKLAQQLSEQSLRFLSDKSRNYVDGDKLIVSKIFSWYQGDFEQNWQGITSLPAFLTYFSQPLGLTSEQQTQLVNGDMVIAFGDYNWALNDVH
jgi:hypothetical protein